MTLTADVPANFVAATLFARHLPTGFAVPIAALGVRAFSVGAYGITESEERLPSAEGTKESGTWKWRQVLKREMKRRWVYPNT